MTLQWESFYAAAKDADVLIYNSTVTEALPDLDALLAKNPLLADFAAVQNRRSGAPAENLYQAPMGVGKLIGHPSGAAGRRRPTSPDLTAESIGGER